MQGCRLSESDDHNKAILFFTKAINLKPEVVKYYATRGESYLHICDFQSAILNFKKACILDPDNDQTYSRLAFLYFLQGQCMFDEKLYSEALESFSRAAEMKPEVIGYHTRRFVAALFSFISNFKTPFLRLKSEGLGKNNNNNIIIIIINIIIVFTCTSWSHEIINVWIGALHKNLSNKLIRVKLQQ